MSFSSRFDMALARVLPRIIRAVEDRILATVSQMLADRERPVAHLGLIVSGSYDPSDATVEVLLGDTFALIGDDGDLPSTLKKIPLHTSSIGVLEPPLGGERAVFNDLGTTFHHDTDDSPGAAQYGSPGVLAGEKFRGHPNPAAWASGQVTYDAYDHMTNDGKTAGDGKAGRQMLVGGYAKFFTTDGFAITLDDAGQLVSISTPGGGLLTLSDANAQIVATYGSATWTLDSATGTFQMSGSGTASANAAVRESDLQAAINNLCTAIQTWAEAHFASSAAGSGWSGPKPTAPTVTASAVTFTT